MFGILMIPLHRGQCSSVHWSFTQLAILVSCLFTAGVLNQDNKITCNAPSVKPLEDVVMTCHFPEDLDASKKDFTVYRYDKSGSPEAVVDCWWINGKLDCFAQSSIEYNKTVGTDLTLVFKRLTSALSGRYTCQVAGYGPEAVQPCEIQFQFERENLCKVDYKISESKAELTCYFNEDVASTRRNFTVYKHNGQDKEIVIGCSWEDRQTRCRVENGYQYNDEVSSYLILEIPEVTKTKEGNYSCWHSGSEFVQQKTCSLNFTGQAWRKPTRDEDGIVNSLAIGLSIGLLILAVIVACGIFFLLKNKGKNRSRNYKDPEVEGQQMINIKETTRMFQEYLEEQVKRMYPDILESYYFVPPVYFNKIRYKPQSVAGQVVYVSDPCDPSDVQQDRAMQHVLHCLRALVEHENERMFVLSQFQYDDYLNNPGHKYEQHSLPVPSGLKNVEKQVGCFDLLIVHRVHGVLAGVVKSVGNIENQGDEETADKNIALQVTEAIQQLTKAEQMLKHLMSDCNSLTKVGLTLMLPDLTRSSLKRAVEGHKDLVESLYGCLGEDPIELALCADDLSDPRKPWEVSNEVINHILDIWKWTIHRTQDNDRMNNDLYLKLISRFFGPATQPSLETQDKPFLLPKTLSEAVSVTGDLYNRPTLSQEMFDLLKEKRVFLVGPPNTCKTRLLTLVGKKWITSGHELHVFCGSASSCTSLTLAFREELRPASVVNDNEKYLPNKANVKHLYFDNEKKIDETVRNLTEQKREQNVYVIADEADVDGYNTFITFLHTFI